MRWAIVLAAVLIAALAIVFVPRSRSPGTEAPAIATDESDDTDFLFGLGMMEGHLMIGHQLIQAHQAALGLPHYGHPVRELYADIEDYLTAKHFPAFHDLLVKLEAQATAAPEGAETEKTYQAVIATLHRARETTPATLRASLPQMIQICSDTIDAASGEYGQAVEQGKVTALVEYHDSKGYLEYVAEALAALSVEHTDAASQQLIARFRAVLARAQWIVEPLLPDPTPRASLEAYRAIVAEGAAIAKE